MECMVNNTNVLPMYTIFTESIVLDCLLPMKKLYFQYLGTKCVNM